MRSLVVLVALALVGCSFDASAPGGGADGGSGSGTTRGDASEGGGVVSTGGSGSGSTGASADGDSSTGSGASSSSSTSGSSSSSSEGSSSDSTSGDPPALVCAGQDALAACYDFAGVGRGMLLDGSGNGNDAAAVGVGVVPGPFGEAATFDAESEIAVPDSPSLDIAGLFTVEAWILVDAVPSDGRVGVVDNEGQYSLMIYAGDQYRCDISGASLYVGPVVVGEWSHVACVFDGAALRAYVNGTEVGMLAATGPLLTENGDPMAIGDTSPDFAEPLSGAVGGVRVWSRALEPTELCEAAGDACGG